MKRCFFDFDSTPLHVVNRCPYPEWPIRNQELAWQVFAKVIDSFQHEYNLRTHAFVLMSNHYHWLCSTANKDLDLKSIFNWFDHVVAMEFFLHNDFVDPEPHVDGPFDLYNQRSEIFVQDHIESYRNTYAYIYRNPVAAGLVSSAEDYPYSTLHYILGNTNKKLPFICIDDMNAVHDPQRLLGYINGPTIWN